MVVEKEEGKEEEEVNKEDKGREEEEEEEKRTLCNKRNYYGHMTSRQFSKVLTLDMETLILYRCLEENQL